MDATDRDIYAAYITEMGKELSNFVVSYILRISFVIQNVPIKK